MSEYFFAGCLPKPFKLSMENFEWVCTQHGLKFVTEHMMTAHFAAARTLQSPPPMMTPHFAAAGTLQSPPPYCSQTILISQHLCTSPSPEGGHKLLCYAGWWHSFTFACTQYRPLDSRDGSTTCISILLPIGLSNITAKTLLSRHLNK